MSDHLNLLDKTLCLSLNKSWQPLGFLSVKKALVCIFSEGNDEKAAMPLDITMGVDENGDDILISANPVTLDQWLQLPIRENDLYVSSAHQKIRVPTVIVSAAFNKMPMRKPRFGKTAVANRDGFVCQYTGEFTGRTGGNIDHVIPRDLGGRDEWGNVVWCKKSVNSMKANRLPHEVGLKLLRKPKMPPALPVSATITEAKHPTWMPFLIK